MPKEGSGDAARAISPTAVLVKKKKVRGGHKAYLNKTVGIVNALLREIQPNQALLLLKQNKAILEERLKTITVIDDQVLELIDDEEEILREIDEAGSFSENVHKILIEIEDKLQSLEVSQNGNAPGNASSPQGGASCFAKLPKLQLRKFYGKLHKWQEFWDSFCASVDNNSNLNDAMKLEYLKCQCEGAAYQAIAGLELTNDNYEVAVNVLKQRFGQRQDILNAHMDALLYINTVHKNAEISELRKFYDTVETHSKGLQSLGVDEQAYGTVLVNVLLKRLPEDIQLIISRKMAERDDGSDWKLPQLLELLKLEIEAREKCSHGKREARRNTGDHYATAATLTTGVKTKPKCTFCQGDHGTVDCRIVTSVQERRNILRKSGRCFLCLRRAGHLAKDCDASIKCFACKGRHHVALCEGRKPGEYYGGIKQQPSSNTTRTQADQSCQTTYNEQTAQTSFCGVTKEETGKGVLLQTAFVTARNPQEPSRRVNLRVILDSGSQRSYISEKARNYLQLSPVKHEDISIKVFGSNESNDTRCDVVKVGLGARHLEFETEVSALVVPTICSPLQGQTVRWAKKNYAHLKNLNLADFPKETETELSVDILIGNDVMWRLLTGEIIKGETDETPVAVGTKFGWVLSGVVADIPRSLLSAVNLTTTHLLRVECQSQVVGNSIADKVLDRKVNELFELETLGITEVDSVEETFTKDIQFEQGHYKIKLPWREHHDILPDNYQLSVGRLNSTLKRLRKDPSLLKEYDNVIQEQIKSGIVEEVRPNLIEQTDVGRVHYLSHHCVVRQDATTTKVRVVLDGSAKMSAESPSLNECLYTGPSLTPNILDILLRFRSYKVALVSDNRGEPTVHVGDIVTVHEEKTPRGFWRLGKIEKVIESKDGLIRGATVKVVTPTGQISLINRPITKLFPVEIVSRELEELSNTPDVVDNGENRRDGRPRRAAALDADLLRRMRDEL